MDRYGWHYCFVYDRYIDLILVEGPSWEIIEHHVDNTYADKQIVATWQFEHSIFEINLYIYKKV